MCGTLFPSTLAPPGSTSVTAYEKVVGWVGLGGPSKAAGFSETGGERERWWNWQCSAWHVLCWKREKS